MASGRTLLLMALRFDIDNLRHLAAACDMVGDISRFIHVLQRERGASTIYLASKGKQFATRRTEFMACSQQAEALMRTRLEALCEKPRPEAGARLLRRIATVWLALDDLPRLRAAIDARELTPDGATRAFNDLIGGLLAIVFEAADTAADPDITRALVAIFHLMQGKELAGQERACGAFGFTYGHFDEPHRALLERLTQDQNRCFDTFLEFAGATTRESWHQTLCKQTLTYIETLRESAHRGERARSDSDARMSETWYALTTQRIDSLKQVEDTAIDELAALCHVKIEAAQRAFDEAHTPRVRAQPAPCEQLLALGEDRALGDLTLSALSSPLGRSLIELTHAQSSRLQGLSDELENTRKALRERKLIERAKGLIMAHQSMSEEQAYRFLRKTSMDQSKSMASMAQSILDLSSMLSRQAP
ncbi:nitrate- and nitrite sensing domain-containing protein [Halomonas sp. HMF6819]|uniref:nitrate- and nitrite sensing domain-containing protein n=1 Tax=Halomonas sp. HMF6819 TaxID=3373085 RepID=UPI0037A71AF4